MEDDEAGANCDNKSSCSDSEYVRQGLFDWLCNKPKQAEGFLREGMERTPILAAYSFVLCMVSAVCCLWRSFIFLLLALINFDRQNGIISCQVDKIKAAQEILKTLEKRCLTASVNRNANPVQSIWRKTFTRRQAAGNSREICVETIEEQIILADAYLLTAALSFMMEDISG